MIDMVPRNASILTQNNLFPHFSNRINAYVVPVVQPESDSATNATKKYIRQQINLSDYILLDSVALGSEPWISFVLDELSSSNDFRPYALGGSAVLFMKHYNGSSFFIPSGDHEVFLGQSAFIIPYAQVINDPTSSSGYVAYSQRGTSYSVFVYGPYVFLPPGTFDVTFEVKFGEHNEGYLGTIEVSDNYGTSILSKEDIYGFDTPANTWTNYTLSLATTTLRRAVEFRIFTRGAADIYFDEVILKRVGQSADTDFGTKTYSQEDLFLGPGKLTSDGFVVWKRNVSSTVLWYGPYTTFFPGTYKTAFFIKASPALTSPNQKVLTLEVSSLYGSDKLATRDVYASDLFDSENASSWHSFTLEFTSDQQTSNVEFRGVNPSPDVDIYLGYILVERIT